MAATKTQGSYVALFWIAITALCAGLAYFELGAGKLFLLLGLAGVAASLLGFMKLKETEGKTAGPAGSAVTKLVGILVVLGGWLVTVIGIHLVPSTGGRILFAVAGIAVSLVGIIGVLTMGFGKSMAGQATASSFVTAKTTMEHTR